MPTARGTARATAPSRSSADPPTDDTLDRVERGVEPGVGRPSAAPDASAAPYGGDMLITHLGHACLLVEMADTRILIDPGAFSDDLSGVPTSTRSS